MFKTTSKQGAFQITDEGVVQVIPLFTKQALWSTSISAIQSISVRHGKLMYAIAVHIGNDQFFIVENLNKADMDSIRALLPGVPFNEIAELPVPAGSTPVVKPARKPQHWYEDESSLTHVATYTKEKEFAAELEIAYQHGWAIQGQNPREGKVSAGKVIGGALIGGVLTGGIGLGVGALIGAKRGKDKITITYVRSTEWLAAHRP